VDAHLQEIVDAEVLVTGGLERGDERLIDVVQRQPQDLVGRELPAAFLYRRDEAPFGANRNVPAPRPASNAPSNSIRPASRCRTKCTPLPENISPRIPADSSSDIRMEAPYRRSPSRWSSRETHRSSFRRVQDSDRRARQVPDTAAGLV